jgi:hypothetical protein
MSKMLVWLLPDPEIGFKPLKKGLVVFGQGFFDFAGQGFQVIMKNRVLEDIQKIPAKIQGGQLGHGQGHGDAFPGFQHEPQAFAALFFIVDGKSRSMEGDKIPVNRPGMTLQPVCDVGNRSAGFRIDQHLQNFPLPS